MYLRIGNLTICVLSPLADYLGQSSQMEIGPILGGGGAQASGLWPNRADSLSELEKILSNFFILQHQN